MVVTADSIQEVLEGDEFVKYYRKVEVDKNHLCHVYTEHFVIEGHKLKVKKNVMSIDILDSVKFLLADYFRSKHAAYSSTCS